MKKRLIAIVLAMGILTMGQGVSFAEDQIKDENNNLKLSQDKPVDVYVINHRLFLKVEDVMSILGYTKSVGPEYIKGEETIAIDVNNKSIVVGGLPRNLGEDLQIYGTGFVISTKAVEDIFNQILVTSGNQMTFAVQNASQAVGSMDWTENRMIAHALGNVNGMLKTNTLEAMQESARKGFKVFEVDLLSTLEGNLVASPGFYEYLAYQYGRPIPLDKQGLLPTKAEFMSFNPMGSLNTLDIEAIIKIMSVNKDIYLVTDTKETDYVKTQNIFKELVRVVNEIDPTVLDRIIPQIYNEQMYDAVKSQYDFKSIIYTLYATSATNDEVLNFATIRGIKVVTVPYERLTPELISNFNAYGIKIYTHTVNDPALMSKYKNMGVHGFYSDTISPGEYNNIR